MTYTLGIPAAGRDGSQDYQPMQNNFTVANSAFGTDHTSFVTAGSTAGFHQKSTYVSQGSDPTPQSSAGIAYTKSSNMHTELFYEGEVTTGKVLQITNQSLTTSMGQGMMPGGLQVRAGSGTLPNNSHTASISFTPNFATLISIVTSAAGSDTTQNCTPSNQSTSGFTLNGSKTSLGYFWIAIGY
jgi:hypothetical protein